MIELQINACSSYIIIIRKYKGIDTTCGKKVTKLIHNIILISVTFSSNKMINNNNYYSREVNNKSDYMNNEL